ncbi:hypothetical protein N9R31_00785 [bacterium]|nr:hypothetical protein [bacterium]MDC0140529.1 hypothetical protein [bacterium]MDC0587473.1 hypothetical protein [bacterium]MDC1335105.1 hypothetical protein [Planktomarina temperata]
MQFEIAGKGVVCNVYYIEKQKLDEISPLTRETGPGLKDLLLEHSDCIINVSRGFFSDNHQANFKFTLSNGETIEQSFFEDKVAKLIEQDDFFEEYEDSRDFRSLAMKPREKDITDSQVALIEYHSFEQGIIRMDIPCDEPEKILQMKLICESVDGYGPDGEDLATTATYGEGVVGSEEYDHAEYAIVAIEVDGKRYLLPEASFEKSHSRVWLWEYDDECGEHGLDFFGSQALPDPWVVDLIDLEFDELYENFDQDHQHLRKVHKFFNQQTLEWIKDNPEYTSRYVKNHTATKKFLMQSSENLELPDFTGENRTLDICTLLCMFLEAFGISGYDPQKLSALDEFEMELEDLKTHTLGNELLLKSLKQSFCMHFDVISTVSLGEESFQEMSHPSLADAIRFANEVLDDPDASFNQQ